MNLVPWRKQEVRSDPNISLADWADMLSTFSYQGVQYTMPGAKQELIGANFSSVARSAYKGNGVVFACMLVRMLLFSEARFQFRRLGSQAVAPAKRMGENTFEIRRREQIERDLPMVSSVRAGQLFGTPALSPLEHPWPGGTTGDLLTKMMLHADLGGNAFPVRRPSGNIFLPRPDWVTLIIGSNADNPDGAAWDPDAEVVAIAYKPGGPGSGQPAQFFQQGEFAHFAPIPDPEAQFRGMSWLTPLAREVMADKATTDHKLAFLENGAAKNLVVKLDVDDINVMSKWIDSFREQHSGPLNKFRTMFLGAGAETTVVGTDLRELDFKVVQAGGETRIAAAAGVPPVIVGLSEGLESATYSNYGQARRRFADGTLRPYWRNAAGSLAQIVPPPPGAELWYDTRDISFLREDEKDAAAITSLKSIAMKTLVDAGYDPASVTDAVESGDLSRLSHTGLVSVQLQPPGTDNPAPPDPAVNGTNGHRDAHEAILQLAAAK